VTCIDWLSGSACTRFERAVVARWYAGRNQRSRVEHCTAAIPRNLRERSVHSHIALVSRLSAQVAKPVSHHDVVIAKSIFGSAGGAQSAGK
jgi:hypothetical protein